MNLASDISTLTTIPVSAINRLFDKEEMCICHKVFENIQQNETITCADVGIGTLYIQHIDNEIKYKFIPSKSFEANLRDTIVENKDILTLEVEQTLKERITNTYKDLF